MSSVIIKKEDIDKLKESIFSKLLNEFPQKIIDEIAGKVNTNLIVNDVLSMIKKPVDGKDGKDAEITEEIVSKITIKVLEEVKKYVQHGRDGKDAEITQEIKSQIAGEAAERIAPLLANREIKNQINISTDEIASAIIEIANSGKIVSSTALVQELSGTKEAITKQFKSLLESTDSETKKKLESEIKTLTGKFKKEKEKAEKSIGEKVSSLELKLREHSKDEKLPDLSEYETKKESKKKLERLIKDLQLRKIRLPYGTGDGWLTGVPLVKEINKSVSVINPLLNHMHEETRPGDEGINITGELHVGTYDNGKESVFGEGDSHTNGMIVFSTPDGGTTFIDNTEAAKSADGSTFETFGGGTTVNAADYLGSDMPLCGIKLKTAALVDPGPTGTVAREYWDGLTWADFKAMASDSDFPYEQRANNIGTVVGSEQIRFGDCENQVKTTVNGVEKYWVRFRITSDITSTGQIEQFKLHTNRFEINADGFTEYFGTAVYPKDLLVHWELTQELIGFSPLDEAITFAAGLTLQYAGNRLKAGQNSGRGGVIEIPEGLDTSKPLQGELTFMPLTDVGGDLVFEGLLYQTRDGDTLSAANVPRVDRNVLTIPPNSANTLIKARSTQDVENLLPGEYLVFGVKRLGADIADTYTGDIAVIGIRSVGFFWKP